MEAIVLTEMISRVNVKYRGGVNYCIRGEIQAQIIQAGKTSSFENWQGNIFLTHYLSDQHLLIPKNKTR